MKPFTIYHLFPEAFTALQQPLVDIIVKAAKPDRIFLLGASLHRRRSESIFSEPAPSSQYISDCFLLVLLADPSGNELHEWQDKLETRCRRVMPITSIVLPTERFAAWLKEGHPFARKVCESAVSWYDSGNWSPEIKEHETDKAAAKEEEQLYKEGLEKAKEFLVGSELYRLRKQYTMAAFMLHQSAEQALRSLLKWGTGYHANTHSLERLIRYASLVCCQLPDVFPQRTEEHKRLFQLLQQAYINTRYKEYEINEEDLLCLTNRINYLHQLADRFGKTHHRMARPLEEKPFSKT